MEKVQKGTTEIITGLDNMRDSKDKKLVLADEKASCWEGGGGGKTPQASKRSYKGLSRLKTRN